MRRRALLLALATSVLLGGSAIATSLRSTELLYYECRQDDYRRDITLFANGTVRLRDGLLGRQSLRLVNLEQGEFRGAVQRLRKIDLSETEERYESDLFDDAGGCLVALELAGEGTRREVRFGSMEVHSLALTQIVDIAEEIGAKTRRLDDPGRNLPEDYQPEIGDVLRRFDGLRFEVLYFSADRLEVELEGLDQPLTLVVPIVDLHEVFDTIEPGAKRGKGR